MRPLTPFSPRPALGRCGDGAAGGELGDPPVRLRRHVVGRTDDEALQRLVAGRDPLLGAPLQPFDDQQVLLHASASACSVCGSVETRPRLVARLASRSATIAATAKSGSNWVRSSRTSSSAARSGRLGSDAEKTSKSGDPSRLEKILERGHRTVVSLTHERIVTGILLPYEIDPVPVSTR
jgi:hypothetical protein